MTFRMTAEHLYWWPVEIRVPSADAEKAGELELMTMKLQFAAIDRDEANKLSAEIAALPEKERETREHAHLERVARNWADVIDDDSNPVPFSMATLRQAMQRSWFRIGVYKAYVASINGDEARTKN